MGKYLNPGADKFIRSLKSEIYVDKSEVIQYTNKVIDTEQMYVCVSRPRRFGKSMITYMLSAYYNRNLDAADLFENFKIAADSSYLKHKNQYDVIAVDMQEFLSLTNSVEEMLSVFQRKIINEIKKEFDIEDLTESNLVWALDDVYHHTKRKFIIIIDEWDCVLREKKNNLEFLKKYLDFLRLWLKGQEYIGLVYMTGILPVKKYGTHSVINMFTEYSMLSPKESAGRIGFTESEVKELCDRYQMDFMEMKSWYDGYHFDALSIYNPRSVVEAVLHKTYDSYRGQTETYEALKVHIQRNFDGLRDAVVKVLAGETVKIDPRTFSNDMITFESKDDILTLLVHLGYLSYDMQSSTVSIPNEEIAREYITTIKTLKWEEIIHAVRESENILKAIWNMDEKSAAKGMEKAHQETSIIDYNSESALSYTINLALYAAREYYTMTREQPSGSGFIDVCFKPRKKYPAVPAMIIEFKWNKSVKKAISQIREREYQKDLKEYKDNLLLVGINYSVKTKKHTCKIERF